MVGTVRDLNSAKTKALKEGLGNQTNLIKLVEADLMKKETIISAISGATYVIHTASPVPLDM